MALTIRVVDPAHTTGDCGGAEMVVDWVLGPNDIGYVVQHVVFTFGDFDCEDDEPISVPRTLEYWEAWEVVWGVVYDGLNRGGANASDPAVGMDWFVLADDGNGTYGTNQITGKVTFIPLFRMPPAWIGGPERAAGGLPNSYTPPVGWTDAGALNHQLTVTWDCCDDSDEEPKVVGDPEGHEPFEPAPDLPLPHNDDGPQNAVAVIIARIPPWAPVADQPLAAIQRGLEPLRAFTLAEIRAGMTDYAAWARAHHSYRMQAMSRLYLTNRYVLAVPEHSPEPPIGAFGGWLHPPGDEKNLLWPFRAERDGDEVCLTDAFLGYAGRPYDALGEFDAFVAFGPRWQREE